jgi:peptidoglycan hydrolase-like protein with peptidoglycan-binding domain
VRTAAKRPAAPRYTAQQQPTADRYREIQQALADRGYFQGTADGTWGPDSADALRRFQVDQDLDADGKISSLSLIALGLGPKYENAAVRTSPASESGSEPTPAPVPTAPPLAQ